MPQIKSNICPERRLSFKLYSNAPICIVLQKRVFILFGSVQLPHCEDNWPKIELMAKIRGGQLWLKRRRSCPEQELFVFDLARASRVLILTTLDHQGLTTSGKIEQLESARMGAKCANMGWGLDLGDANQPLKLPAHDEPHVRLKFSLLLW